MQFSGSTWAPRNVATAVWVAIALLTASSPNLAFADERTEARRHFRRGMDLVVEGFVDAGIAELQAAYDVLPHPNVLYNIGRAYAEAGRYEEAIDYFDRYLSFGPADADEVRGFIGALNARLAAENGTSVAANDAGADTSAAAETTSGTSAVQSPTDIAALREAATRLDTLAQATGSSDLSLRAASLREFADRLERQAASAAEASQTHEATTDATTDSAATGSSATATSTAGVELAAAETELYEERFVSSTRAAVDPLDAPNSTTIITRQDIRLTGLTTVGDLLRRVAGVQVMSTGPTETNVGIRGFNQKQSPRVLLLINGRSTYIDPLGITLWNLQPVSIEDIERIEVVRGPASALYGANGFSGIVNVITRTPGDDPGSEFSVSAGSGGQVRGHFGTSGRRGRFGYRLSATYDAANRFTMPVDPRRVDAHIPDVTNDPRYAQRGVRAFGNATYRLTDHTQASVEAGTIVMDPVGITGTTILEEFTAAGTSSFAMAGVQSEWGGVRFFWNNFDVEVDQFGTAPFDLDVLWNTYDLEATFSHGFDTGSVHHDLIAGAGYRRKFVDWSVFAHSYTEDHFQGFFQDSIELGRRFTIIGGMRVDRHPLLAHAVLSPRGALVGRVGERQSIRASVSTAFRTQNFLESYVDTLLPSPNSAVSVLGAGSDVSRRVFGAAPLKPERILSAEIGYQNQENDRMSFDVAAFFNRVEQLIGLSSSTRIHTLADASNPALAGVTGFDRTSNTFDVGTVSFENLSGTYFVGGFEAIGRFYPVDGLDVHANYSLNIAYVDRAGGLARTNRAPMHQANVGVQYRKNVARDVGLDVSVDVHGQSRTEFDELVTTGATLELQPFGLDPLYLVNSRVGVRLVDDRLSFAIVGTNINALWGQNYRQHPFTQPIAARVLATVAFRF